MNPTNLIRCAAATLAAATLLTAQSAPLPSTTQDPSPRAPKAEPRSTERMQVRLAEVIAMLEEDDLSPEQRAQAKKKLQEIVARLRETPAAATTPAPSPSRPRTLTFRSAEGGEGKVVLVPQEPAPPATPAMPAMPGKAPKPPKPPKAPKPEKGEVLELVDVTHGEPGPAPKVLNLSGGKVTQLGGGKVLIEIPEGTEWAEVAKPLKVQGQDLRGLTIVQGEKVRAEAAEAAEVAEAVEEARRAERDAVRQRGQAARAEAEALRAQRDEASSKRAAETRAKVDRAIAEVREREQGEWRTAPQAKPESRVRVLRTPGTSKEEGGVKVIEVAPLHGDSGVRVRSASPRDDDRDDAEIKQLIEEMRAEMREIRKLIQQMKQTQSAAGQQAGGQGRFLFGGATTTAPAPASTAPGVRRVRASGGGAGGGSGAGAGFGSGTSSNDAAGAAPVLIEVNGQPVESKEQAVQTVRSQYEAGARSFATRWLDRGSVVERGYQAPMR